MIPFYLCVNSECVDDKQYPIWKTRKLRLIEVNLHLLKLFNENSVELIFKSRPD